MLSLTREVVQAVEGFTAVTDRERLSKNRVLIELDRLPHPFDRHAGPVHVTGSALISGQRGTVLHVHKRLGIWLQPGGHIDPGEAPWEAAAREAQEETGLGARHPAAGPKLYHVDVHPAGGDHIHLDLRYLLIAEDVPPAPAAGESQVVRWFSLDDAIGLADAGLVDALHRMRAEPLV